MIFKASTMTLFNLITSNKDKEAVNKTVEMILECKKLYRETYKVLKDEYRADNLKFTLILDMLGNQEYFQVGYSLYIIDNSDRILKSLNVPVKFMIEQDIREAKKNIYNMFYEYSLNHSFNSKILKKYVYSGSEIYKNLREAHTYIIDYITFPLSKFVVIEEENKKVLKIEEFDRRDVNEIRDDIQSKHIIPVITEDAESYLDPELFSDLYIKEDETGNEIFNSTEDLNDYYEELEKELNKTESIKEELENRLDKDDEDIGIVQDEDEYDYKDLMGKYVDIFEEGDDENE